MAAAGGTEAFPDLGRHCQHSDCHQLDFLPFTCDGCQKVSSPIPNSCFSTDLFISGFSLEIWWFFILKIVWICRCSVWSIAVSNPTTARNLIGTVEKLWSAKSARCRSRPPGRTAATRAGFWRGITNQEIAIQGRRKGPLVQRGGAGKFLRFPILVCVKPAVWRCVWSTGFRRSIIVDGWIQGGGMRSLWRLWNWGAAAIVGKGDVRRRLMGLPHLLKLVDCFVEGN